MERTDVLAFVFGYFFLVVFVWGYAIAFYYSELEFLREGSDFIHEEEGMDTGINPLSWRGTDMLKEGQKFYYYIELPKKSMTLDYEVIKEMRAGFLIKGNSRSYGIEKERGLSPTIKEYLKEENFFVVRKSGGVKTVTYTSSFWNGGLCHPLKSYFYGEPLVFDSSWDVLLPENARAHVSVVSPGDRTSQECFACVIEDGGVENRVTICRDVPVVAEYSGERCQGESMKMTLEDYLV